MAQNKFDIYVYAHWKGMAEPELTGILSAHFAKGKKAFSFEYDKDWIKTKQQMLLDPDLQFYTGPQYPNNHKENFGIFLDSMPDTWGRTLMKRRVAQEAKAKDEKPRTLYDIDFLLGVYDESRMGALRFKTDPDGQFLDHSNANPTPPWSSIRELQHAAKALENDDDQGAQKWLAVLMAPGSSLGGARPKANILDENKELWIAKFPSKNDTIDKAAWELLAYELALEAGINMAPCRMEKIAGPYNTFFTKRFDREGGERIHFASAMTMTGNSEDTIRDHTPSYLEIADFIQNKCVNITENLHQLWRRIVFNIAISNTDDHLRNHGFVLTDAGWELSPAYDINPSVDKDGLAMNIDTDNNALDYGLAKSVGAYYRLSDSEMDVIIDEVMAAVRQWKGIATKLGISRGEQELMRGAFRV